MKEIIENPNFEDILKAYEKETCVFLCPDLDPRESEYYKTIFKQFAPENSVGFLSSGSSGSPKIHLHSWKNLKKRASAQANILDLDKDSFYLSPLPIHHLSGFMPILRSIISGSKLAVLNKEQSLEDELIKLKPTHVSMVPTQMAKLVKKEVDLSFLKTLLLGGSGCEEKILQKAKELRYPVRACYGMTESASFFSIGRSEEFLKDAGIKLYLMDNWKAYADQNGRLTLESDEMFLGTIGALGFKESKGILPTYDIGSVEHPVINIIGRSDLVFKSGAEKVDPLEVERKLLANEVFTSVVIVPKKDETWGSVTCAFIKPFRRGRDYSLLVEHLPSHQRPRYFFPLEESNGIKPKRSSLIELANRNFKREKKLPRVAFIHGFMGSHNDLKVLASSLEDSLFPIFWKLPFHGLDNKYKSFDDAVDFYVEKVRTEDIDALYGYSMGGRLATAISQKLEELGEPLSALILESSHLGLTSEEEKKKRITSDLTLFERMPSNPEEFFNSWYSQSLFGDFKESELGKITINEMLRRWNPESWKDSLALLSTGHQQDFRPFFKKTSHPVLYLAGENDSKYRKLALELEKNENKKISVKCLKRGFHNLHLNRVNDLKGPITEVLSSLN
ncbi:MAG: hypothetical protein CME70_14565 [Halobacteriovorax sp.]|nr:hypothetical protein [Halobacteriovorax sp.]